MPDMTPSLRRQPGFRRKRSDPQLDVTRFCRGQYRARYRQEIAFDRFDLPNSLNDYTEEPTKTG